MLVLDGSKGEATHLAFSPDAKLLAASNTAVGLEMWDVPARRKWGRFTGIRFRASPAAFHPTEPRCFAECDRDLAVIDTAAETVRALATPVERLSFRLPAVAPDGGSCVGRIWTPAGEMLGRYTWRATGDLRELWTAPFADPTPRAGTPLEVTAIRAAPDGDTFAVVCGRLDRATWTTKPVSVSLRAMKTGAGRHLFRLPPATANVLAFAPDSRAFVTCRAHILSVWSSADPTAEPREVRSDNRKHFTGVAFHPSGRFLAAISNDATVKLYDTTTWEVARTFTWDIGRMRSIAFSPDGTLAAAGSDTGEVVVWDVDV